MLNFEGSWRFRSPGAICTEGRDEFRRLIGGIATQGDSRQAIIEHFKDFFARVTGQSSSWSSSPSWAESDLDSYLDAAAENAPLFIEAFYDAIEALRQRHPMYALPNITVLNDVLGKFNAGFYINPPNLVTTAPPTVEVQHPPSFDEQAKILIEKSLGTSQRYLRDGDYKQAVQEVLWLLETVSTAFRGIQTGEGAISGKYFNKIADELRRHHKGTFLDQVLGWINTLHGFLSAPAGGGVRHGTELSVPVELQRNEAELLCNLIRSYISFLMQEHERFARK